MHQITIGDLVMEKQMCYVSQLSHNRALLVDPTEVTIAIPEKQWCFQSNTQGTFSAGNKVSFNGGFIFLTKFLIFA